MRNSHFVRISCPVVMIAAAATAFAAGLSSAASANLKPGQYDVNGLEQICLVDDGTWYSTTFYHWRGMWQIIGNEDKAIVYGHYDDEQGDVGEDSIVLEKDGLIDWTEWSDDFTDDLWIDDVPLTRVKKKCDPEAPPSKGILIRKAPMQ